ncbi:MAG: hypothetical protein K2Y18_01460 [Alphaproteobacteria bacterium]|nr:hypothetical protein [Alphaproteobacteria bacterium]
MRIINAVKAALGVLILMVFLQPLLGVEKVEGEGGAGGQGVLQQEKPVVLDPQKEKPVVLDPQLEALVKGLLDKNQGENEKRIETVKAALLENLKAQEERHKEALTRLEAGHKQDLKNQLEQISSVIKQDPPSIKQRITSSKYIWGIGAVTFGGMAISFFHSCDSFYSIPYATVRAVVENLPLLINSYYVAKIIQESATIKGSVASQAAKME